MPILKLVLLRTVISSGSPRRLGFSTRISTKPCSEAILGLEGFAKAVSKNNLGGNIARELTITKAQAKTEPERFDNIIIRLHVEQEQNSRSIAESRHNDTLIFKLFQKKLYIFSKYVSLTLESSVTLFTSPSPLFLPSFVQFFFLEIFLMFMKLLLIISMSATLFSALSPILSGPSPTQGIQNVKHQLKLAEHRSSMMP
jgi:hypothetical protein